MNKIHIYNPNDSPYGPLSNDYFHSMKIDGSVWNTVSNYLYSNLLIYPNHINLMRTASIKSEINEKQYNEALNRFKKKGKVEASKLNILVTQLDFQKLNIFEKYNLLLNNEFVNSILVALRSAYNYLINESNDDVYRNALIATGNSPLIFVNSNKFFGINEESGYNLVGIVLMELRQGLLIKQNIERERLHNLNLDNNIKNYIVAYQLLVNLIDEGKDIRPYFGSKPIQLINLYIEDNHDKILDNLKSKYGNIENIKSNFLIESEDDFLLSFLSFNDKLKALGYDDQNLNIYLEDYKENRYPILNDIIKSENEPRKRFIANVLYQNKRNQIKENQAEKKQFVIIVNFLAGLQGVDLSSVDKENDIYLKFLNQTKDMEVFNKLCKKIIEFYNEKKHDQLIMIRIANALKDYEEKEKESEESSFYSDDEKENSKDKENDSSESSENDSSEESKIEEDMKRLKYDRIFDLQLELKNDVSLNSLSTKEIVNELKKLFENYNFSTPLKVFEIILNRYDNDNKLRKISLGYFGNQNRLRDIKGKNYGKNVKTPEVYTDMSSYFKKSNEERDVYLKDIEIVEVHDDTMPEKEFYIYSDHILDLSQLNSVIVSGRVFPSPHMYTVVYLYNQFCGVNIGLKVVDTERIKINNFIDEFYFDNSENTLLSKITRGTSMDNTLLKLTDDFHDILKVTYIFNTDLAKTYQFMTVFLLLKSINVKFRNDDLKKVLLLSDRATIMYNDKYNFFIGHNNNGPNIMGSILMSYRNYLKNQGMMLNTMAVYDLLSSSFNSSWCEKILRDMCTIVYRLKYFLNTNIDSSMIKIVLQNLYSFFKIRLEKMPPIPTFVIDIIKECYGLELNIPKEYIDDLEKYQRETTKIKRIMDGIKIKENLYLTTDPKEGKPRKFFGPENMSTEYNTLIKKIREIEDSQQITGVIGRKTHEKSLSEISNDQLKLEEQRQKLLKKANRILSESLGENKDPYMEVLNRKEKLREKQVRLKDKINQLEKDIQGELKIQDKINAENKLIDFRKKLKIINESYTKEENRMRELEPVFPRPKDNNELTDTQKDTYDTSLAKLKQKIVDTQSDIEAVKINLESRVKIMAEIYWMYLYNLASQLIINSNAKGNKILATEFGKIISKFENPEMPSNCEELLKNPESNCIAHALINILVGIQNIKNKMNNKSVLEKVDIDLASNILSDFSIRKERQKREEERAFKNKNEEKKLEQLKRDYQAEKLEEKKLLTQITPKPIEKNLVVTSNIFNMEENEDDEFQPDFEIDKESDEIPEEEIFNFDEYSELVHDDEEVDFGFSKNKFVKFGMRSHENLTNLIQNLKNFNPNEASVNELAKYFVQQVEHIKTAKIPSKNKRINMFVNLG